MSDAFISYSRLDKDFVGRLREGLANKEQDVWIDWESIPASQAWWQEIRKGIAKANNFVLIMSPNSMASPICHMEIEYALEIGKRIIPVVYADFDRKASLMSIAERLATDDETATRDIWGTRQPHDLYDANMTAIKPINYFSFKSDVDFPSRFEDLFTVIKTDHDYKEKHTTLGLRAAEWNRRGRDASFLLLGNELTDAEQWRQNAARDKEPSLTPLQNEYIAASRSSSSRRRFYIGSGILAAGAALVFAVGASLVGVNAVNQVATATVVQGQAVYAQGTALAQVATATFEQGKAQNAAITATVAQGAAVYAQSTAVAQADTAQDDAKTARTEVAVAGVTLTSVPPVLTAVASALADAKVEQDISLKLSDALISVANKDNSDAMQVGNALVKAYPHKASAFVSRAVIYATTDQFLEAVLDLGLALALDPKQELAYFNRGTLYIRLKRYDLAIKDLDKAIALRPNHAEAYYSRGSAYNGQDEPDEAMKNFKKAIELDAQYTNAYYQIGLIYENLEQHDAAIAEFKKVIELDPQFVDAYFGRGVSYYSLKQYDEALADYNTAIELDPSDVIVYLSRGTLYSDLKQTDAALADYSTAIELDPNNVYAHYTRGTLYLDQSEADKALADFSKAIEVNPQHANSYLFRGATYYFKMQYADALADWKQYEALAGALPALMEKYRVRAEAALKLTPTATK